MIWSYRGRFHSCDSYHRRHLSGRNTRMDLPDQTDNRRTADRRALRTSAHIELPGGQYVEVYTVDISTTGIAFIASASPRIGTSFTLSFPVPEKPKGQILCEVRVKVVNSVFSS